MKIHGLGKDIADFYIDGLLDRLAQALSNIEESDYDIAEVPIAGLNVVINGRLQPQRVIRVKEVLSRYALRYTVHAPIRTNLAYGYDHELEIAVMRASIEFCQAIGAQRLVYHSGLQALDWRPCPTTMN